jgi:hypothetical protein
MGETGRVVRKVGVTGRRRVDQRGLATGGFRHGCRVDVAEWLRMRCWGLDQVVQRFRGGHLRVPR